MCQVENKTNNPEKNKACNILPIQKCYPGTTCLIFIRRPPFVLSSNKILSITFDNILSFAKHFEEISERCTQRFHCQEKVGSKSYHHFTDLQTMCKSNISIWDCFYYNCFRHRHQQNTASLELFYWASTSSSKVCVGLPNT